MVLNSNDNTITFYVDGSKIGVQSTEEPADRVWIADSFGRGVARMDCGQDTGYMGENFKIYTCKFVLPNKSC